MADLEAKAFWAEKTDYQPASTLPLEARQARRLTKRPAKPIYNAGLRATDPAYFWHLKRTFRSGEDMAGLCLSKAALLGTPASRLALAVRPGFYERAQQNLQAAEEHKHQVKHPDAGTRARVRYNKLAARERLHARISEREALTEVALGQATSLRPPRSALLAGATALTMADVHAPLRPPRSLAVTQHGHAQQSRPRPASARSSSALEPHPHPHQQQVRARPASASYASLAGGPAVQHAPSRSARPSSAAARDGAAELAVLTQFERKLGLDVDDDDDVALVFARARPAVAAQAMTAEAACSAVSCSPLTWAR